MEGYQILKVTEGFQARVRTIIEAKMEILNTQSCATVCEIMEDKQRNNRGSQQTLS